MVMNEQPRADRLSRRKVIFSKPANASPLALVADHDAWELPALLHSTAAQSRNLVPDRTLRGGIYSSTYFGLFLRRCFWDALSVLPSAA